MNCASKRNEMQGSNYNDTHLWVHRTLQWRIFCKGNVVPEKLTVSNQVASCNRRFRQHKELGRSKDQQLNASDPYLILIPYQFFCFP